MWGCFLVRSCTLWGGTVFPTRVGVFLIFLFADVGVGGIPHACGGVSKTHLIAKGWNAYSPRVWGCFLVSRLRLLLLFVFPTRVGVFLYSSCALKPPPCIPHACGGVSACLPESTSPLMYSPRVWGCFSVIGRGVCSPRVFPTRVGVFLEEIVQDGFKKGIPHACGGVSSSGLALCVAERYSPRVWGCFHHASPLNDHPIVFPTRVGVFLENHPSGRASIGIPHACGGVSYCGVTRRCEQRYSPRVWGCFFQLHIQNSCVTVFPTRVGVFLTIRPCFSMKSRIPHACGGVSHP